MFPALYSSGNMMRNKKAEHLIYSNSESDYYLTETLKSKLKAVGLNYEVNIKFDRNYEKAKTKMVNLSGIHNRASFCPVIIEGDPEAIKFAWNVGVGHSNRLWLWSFIISLH